MRDDIMTSKIEAFGDPFKEVLHGCCPCCSFMGGEGRQVWFHHGHEPLSMLPGGGMVGWW